MATREAWTKPDKPYVVFCPRENQCGERHTARELFPYLYENFSERFPATDANPNATAEAHMRDDRHFDIGIIPRDKWTQGSKRLLDDTFGNTLRFALWEGHYWERLIDAKSIDKAKGKRKARSSFGVNYKDRH